MLQATPRKSSDDPQPQSAPMAQQSTETLAPADAAVEHLFDLTHSHKKNMQLKIQESKRVASDALQSLSLVNSNAKINVASAQPMSEKRDAETSTSAPFEYAAMLERFV